MQTDFIYDSTPRFVRLVASRSTGKERDTESGNDYFGARYYNSATGRFLSPDPKDTSAHPGNPQTWNRYTYTLNNPLGLVDPDGKEPVTVVFRAFIQQSTVGPGRGDNRTFSADANASSRITVTMHIETDPAVNGGHPLIGTPDVQMQDTHTIIGGSIAPVNNFAPIITPSQDANGLVNLNVQIDTHSGAMPAGASIRSDVNIGVNQAGTQGTVQGTVSGSPAFETNFTPQGAPTTNLPIQGAASGTVPFVQNLYKTNPVDKKKDIQQAPQ
jgi:RHS repeat-associated protein